MELSTARLNLRRPKAGDAAAYTEIHNSEFVLRYNAMMPTTPERMEAKFSDPEYLENTLFLEDKETERLIDLDAITVPTLLIYGGNDPYMNYEVLEDAGSHLPDGSDVQIIPGGSHIVILEKPFYQEFQNRVIEFLQ